MPARRGHERFLRRRVAVACRPAPLQAAAGAALGLDAGHVLEALLGAPAAPVARQLEARWDVDLAHSVQVVPPRAPASPAP